MKSPPEYVPCEMTMSEWKAKACELAVSLNHAPPWGMAAVSDVWEPVLAEAMDTGTAEVKTAVCELTGKSTQEDFYAALMEYLPRDCP